jgi:hypothetical protein
MKRCEDNIEMDLGEIGCDYGLDDRGSILSRGREWSLRHRVQTGSGAIQSPIQWVPGLKRPGREVNHFPPFSAKVKNA